jgi:hypothetical protein
VNEPPAFVCPFCAAASHNENDQRHRFCSACGVFVDDVNALVVALMRAEQETCIAARRFSHATVAGRPAAATALIRAVARLERVNSWHDAHPEA